MIVKDYSSQKLIRSKILYGSYLSTDKTVPILRNRGTHLEKNEDGSIHIMGWQKDITRMRKQDVELSFIIYLDINAEGIVTRAEIDKTFNGGKGLLCSRKYLQKTLSELLEGELFEPKIAGKFRLSNFCCFHIHEVMNSIYSSYFLFQQGHVGEGKRFYEEDMNDWYGEDGNLYLLGEQVYAGKAPVKYTICLYDIFNHVVFDSEGYMWLKGTIHAEFYINDQLILQNKVYQGEEDFIFLKLQKFIFDCLRRLQMELAPNYKRKIMNTNMYASAIIGSIMQAVGIRIFADNFNYIQYIMTAMQRPGKIPGCIGSILTEKEASTYFKNFDLNKITD